MSLQSGKPWPRSQGRRRRSFLRSAMRRGCSNGIPQRGCWSASNDVAFWAALEEREDGRFAQEADHLFDTSHSWAT
jgi:hypothetical protein